MKFAKSKQQMVILLALFIALTFSLQVIANNDYRSQATVIDRGTIKVSSASVTGHSDKVDWWKVYIPEGGGIVCFLNSSLADSYRLGFEMYNSNMHLLGSNNSLNEFKPLFGTVSGDGYYYLKVKVLYSGSRKVHYNIGVAFADSYGTLSYGDDEDVFDITIHAHETTWLFLLDRSESFDPDLFIYFDGERIGGSNRAKDLDHVRWDISSTRNFEVLVNRYAGEGKYWLLIARED